MWMQRGLVAAFALAAAACGSRTGLLVSAREDGGAPPPPAAADAGVDAPPDASMPLPLSCPPLPPLPAKRCPTACIFDPELPGVAVMAAIAGTDVVGVLEQGTARVLHHFSGTGYVAYRGIAARGGIGSCGGSPAQPGLIAAMLVTGAGKPDARVELVVLDAYGKIVAQHDETLPIGNESGVYAVTGNDAGTFTFGVGAGKVGRVWIALASGQWIGPVDGVALPPVGTGVGGVLVEPDARARFIVHDWPNGTTPEWLDPCAGTKKPTTLAAYGNGAALGAKLFGMEDTGQLATETADGVMPLGYPFLDARAGFWDFVRPGVAMFSVPPFPSSPSLTATLLTFDAVRLVARMAPLSYPPGLRPTGGAFLSNVFDSNNPAGFGVDSAGRVTMFLDDGTGGSTTSLYATGDGSTWTRIGMPVSYDPMFEPSYSAGFAEAASTYVVRGSGAGGTPAWQVVHSDLGLDDVAGGPSSISYDGTCVASLASSTELEVRSIRNGLFRVKLPSPVNPDAWVSTWIPGDDSALAAH
jgi:hypothetical protein